MKRSPTIFSAIAGLSLYVGLTSSQDHAVYYQYKGNTQKTLIIGIDGCRPDALQKANTQTLDYLMETGAYSLKAQAGTYTVSGPGWSNILTGAWEEKHGTTNNNFYGTSAAYYPDIFRYVESIHPELNTVSLGSWEPLHEFITPIADIRGYYPSATGSTGKMTEDAMEILAQKNPDLMFLHFIDVDTAGHWHGFDQEVPEYIQAIEKVDRHIGDILLTIANRPLYEKEDWLILVTTDHGGKGKSHHHGSLEEKTIFFIAHGNNVKLGELEPSPTHVNVVPTALKHMNITSYNLDLEGKVMGLD